MDKQALADVKITTERGGGASFCLSINGHTIPGVIGYTLKDYLNDTLSFTLQLIVNKVEIEGIDNAK